MSAKETTYDKRTALPDGFELTINEKNTDNKSENTYKITIQRKIASGGSCLVYRGLLDKCVGEEKATYDVIVKEVYPKRLDEEITRSKKYKLEFTSEEGNREYEHFLSHFCKGQVKHVVYATNNSENALPPLFCSGTAKETGAFYAVSRVTSGQVLSEMDLKDYSIVEALELSISLCEAIGKVHEGGRNNDCQYSLGLFLDCKPDNIFVLNNRAYLFDFDTVQPKGDFSFCSYSEGWSAPEQKINSDIGYSDVRKIGYHTDVFSIGSVLFYMLTGENPYEAGLDAIHEGFDWKGKIKLKDTTGALEDEEFVAELNKVMTSILEEKAEIRKKKYGNSFSSDTLLNELQSLIRIANTVTIKKESKEIKKKISENSSKLDNISEYLIDEKYTQKVALRPKGVNRFQYCSDVVSFHGREIEFNELLNMSKDDTPFYWTGICGNGGTGKTRLAYELCKELTDTGWRVYWPSHAKYTADSIKNELSELGQNVLICFDDANVDSDVILDFALFCMDKSNEQYKIRIILIDRELTFSHSFLSALQNYTYKNHINSCEYFELQQIEEKNIKDIIRDYSEYTGKDITNEDVDSIYSSIKKIDKQERPLYALFVCDTWFNNNDIQNSDKKDILDMIVNREFEIVENLIEQEYSKKSEQIIAMNTVKLLIVLSYFIDNLQVATISEAAIDGNYIDLDKVDIQYIIGELGILKEDIVINPYPDILAEYICIDFINSLSKSKTISILEFIFNSGGALALMRARELCKAFDDILVRPTNISIIQTLVTNFTKSLEDELVDKLTETERDELVDIKDVADEVKWLKQHVPDIETNVFKKSVSLFINMKDKLFIDDESDLSNGTYSGQMVMGQPCGYGKMVYSDGKVYEGEWVAGIKSGKGVYLFPDGRRYEGTFKNDYLNGSGTLTFDGNRLFLDAWKNGYPNGSGLLLYDDTKYEVQFDDGKLKDTGKIYFSDGTKYEGQWKNLVPNGKGILYLGDDYYEGEFKNQKISGHGKYYSKGTLLYAGDYKNYQRDGHGTDYYSDGSIRYKGEYKNGKRNGQGCLFVKTNGKLDYEYRGNFKNNLFSGYGICIFHPSGARYEGDFLKDKRHGQGTYYFPDGRYVVGEFKKNKPNGIASLFRADGTIIYKGQMKDGIQHGQGIAYWSDGSRYEGNFVKGERKGLGTFYYSDGSYVVGTFKKNKPNGIATYFRADGTIIYKGQMRNGIKHGQGVMYWSDGSRYEGQMKNGKAHGKGTFFVCDGRRWEGEFMNGQIRGQISSYRPDGTISFIGIVKNEKKNGFGTDYNPDGTKEYEGYFEDGEYNGKGTLYLDSGNRYEGEFINGKYNGHGIEYDPNGNILYEGKWKDGLRQN